ncbi:hypothetical protein [Acinetobacter pittii]|uniref:hypothetical protein n=2 Tax=Acinetobacter calcoaceticus/baumannii complex TaxID=909768 RepID=UPI001023123D|nr:hypothetical protein [Acinetobacter pittii]RZH07604.1 hypothetical protein EXE00_10380 [Acinetobacter pittii]
MGNNVESTLDTSNKINFLLQKINSEVEIYRTAFSSVETTQVKIIQVIPENIRNKVISINNFSAQDNKINLKINNIANIVQEIKSKLNLKEMRYISEKLLDDLYTNLQSVFKIFEKNKKYLQEVISLSEDYYKRNDTFNSIHKQILEHGENTVANNIDQTLLTMLDSRKNIYNELDLIEKAFKDLNNDSKQLIAINNEVKLREDLINNNLVEKIEAEKEKLIKLFNHEASRLFNTVKTNLSNFELDLKSANDSVKNLKDSVDSGIKDLSNLNDRAEKIDLELSKRISEKMLTVNEVLGKNSEEISQNLEQKLHDIDEQYNALRNRVFAKSTRIRNAHNDFIRLVERAGIYELTQNYKEKAVEEKKDYNFFSWATIVAISLAIITTIVIIAIPIVEHWGANPPVETNYFTILARLSISLMFFVLAVYTSKQSSKHYECYQENHRTFLQLAALEPFMARMSEEEQKVIRKGLIPIYFNQNADGKFASKGEELGMQFNMQAFVEKFFEVGKNMTDKNNTDQSKPNG